MLLSEFNEIPAVGMLDIDVPEFHLDLLNTINNALSYKPIYSPLLFGGAPRDHAYNTFFKLSNEPDIIPRDYDVMVPAPEHLHQSSQKAPKKNAEHATEQVLNDLKAYEKFSEAKILKPAYSFESGRIAFKCDGKDIEVVVMHPHQNDEDFVEHTTDSPINGIATNIHGETFIKLEFPDHLQNQIYRFDPDIEAKRFLERMRKMRDHYPNIRGILSPYNRWNAKSLIEECPEIKKEGLLILPKDPDYERFIGEDVVSLHWYDDVTPDVRLHL